jgi:hypothetical protein
MNIALPEKTDQDRFEEAIQQLGVKLSGDPMALIDGVEAAMLDNFQPARTEVRHTFTDKVYGRSFFMPAGTILTSKIHAGQHQFVIQTGCISVWTAQTGWVTMHAPYHGVTEPGTRRILQAHTDTVWTTFHPNPDNITDLAQLEELLIMKHTNHLLEGRLP